MSGSHIDSDAPKCLETAALRLGESRGGCGGGIRTSRHAPRLLEDMANF